jgi:hypothetical protein
MIKRFSVQHPTYRLLSCRRGAYPGDVHVPLVREGFGRKNMLLSCQRGAYLGDVREIWAESASRAGVPGRKKKCYLTGYTDTKGELKKKRLISIAGTTHVCDNFINVTSTWVS